MKKFDFSKKMKEASRYVAAGLAVVMVAGSLSVMADASASTTATAGNATASNATQAKTKKVAAAKLSWSKVKGAKGYVVYYKDGKKLKKVAKLSASKKSYTVTKLNNKNLKANKNYKFQIKAYKFTTKKKAKKTVYFKTINKTVKAKNYTVKIPAKVTNVKLQKKAKAFKVTYKKATAAKGYQVVYSTKKDSAFKTAANTTKTNYTKTKLKAKKTYYVRVRAYNTIGQTKVYGPYTAVKSVKTK